jgi:hypothetical protein
METKYYTKAEVDALLAKQKEDLLEIILDKIPSKGTTFKFKMLPGRVMGDKRLWILHEYLIKNGLIEKVSKEIFLNAFKGETIESIEKGAAIKWIGDLNLCPYLLDQLAELFYIDRDKIDKKANDIFGIENAAQLRTNYSHNKNGKPRKAILIKEIINALNTEKEFLQHEEDEFKRLVLDDIASEETH